MRLDLAALLAATALASAGCNSLLGIDDHALSQGDGATSTIDAPSDHSSVITDDASTDATADTNASEQDTNTDAVEEAEAESGAAPCVEGTTQCSGQTPQKCTNGQWVSLEAACPYVCSADAGSCTGTCVPGTKQCNGTTPQNCDSTGTWVNGTSCPNVCYNGNCTGSCMLNAKQCSNNIPQTCDSTGKWVDGQACPYVCASGSCSGVCAPNTDTRQCGGAGCAMTQTCQANGTWPSCALPSSCQCSGSQTTSCTTSTYSCPGTETCVNYQWGPCVANGTCNCSNGTTQSCNSSACNPSTLTCANNKFPACPAPVSYTHDTGVLSSTGFAQTYVNCTPVGTINLSAALATCAAVVGSSNCSANACNSFSVTGVAGSYAFNWEYTGSTAGYTDNYSIGNVAACFPLSNCSTTASWCGGDSYISNGNWN